MDGERARQRLHQGNAVARLRARTGPSVHGSRGTESRHRLQEAALCHVSRAVP